MMVASILLHINHKDEDMTKDTEQTQERLVEVPRKFLENLYAYLIKKPMEETENAVLGIRHVLTIDNQNAIKEKQGDKIPELSDVIDVAANRDKRRKAAATRRAALKKKDSKKK